MVAHVKMVSTVIPVTAREDIPEVTVKQTLTTALTIHVRTVGPVWMVSTTTHANAQ